MWKSMSQDIFFPIPAAAPQLLPAFTDSKFSYIFFRGPGVRPTPPPVWEPDTTPCGINFTCLPEGNTTLLPVTGVPGRPVEGEGGMLVEFIGYVYVMPILCFIGIVLNSLTVIVLNCRQFKSPTYTYLCALATADIITCIFTFPIGVSRCGECEVDKPKLIYELYVFMPITNMSETMSAWMVVLLAIERLATIKRHTTDRTYKEARKRGRLIALGVAAAAIALNIPYYFAVTIDDEIPKFQHFDDQGIGFSIFSWTRATLVQFLPLILLVILNCFLLVQVRRSHQRYRRLSVMSRQSVREFAQLRLTLMLVGTVVLFILGNVPVALAYTVLFQAIFGKEALYSDFYVNWRVITHLISITCYGLDFVVYCTMNPYFRAAVAGVLTCHRRKRKITDVSTSHDYLSPQQSPANSTGSLPDKEKF